MFLVYKAATGIHLYICVRERARNRRVCRERSADISDIRCARGSLSLSLSFSSSLAPRAGERKKGKTKVGAKRNAGSLTARRRRAMAVCLCPVLLVHSARVTGATATRTTVKTPPRVIVTPATTTTATITTTATTTATTTEEVPPAAARWLLDDESNVEKQ